MFDPRTLPNGAFWPNFGLFVSIGLMLGAQVADYITTVKGMAKGLVEGNPIQKWLFGKIGVAAGSFVSMMATLLISFLFLGFAGIAPATVFALGVAAAETVQSILNYRKL
jgi:hypothetical protein